jgi:RND family efflux transporter MFP subunit
MKKLWHSIAICSTLLIYISSCTPSAKDDGLGHNHDHGSHGGGNHGGEIVLSTEQAQKFGVYSQMVKPRDFNNIIKVSGQIESAPTEQSIVAATAPGIVKYTPGIVEGKIVSKGAIIARISSKSIAGGDPNESARIAVDATKRELDRLTPLHEDGIVSTKEYNAAKQAYEEACAAYSGTPTGGAAKASTSGAITQLLVKEGEYVATGQPIAVISGTTRLTLRADLPEKYYNQLATITTASFKPSYSNEVIPLSDVNGKLVSVPTTATAQQTGYIPIHFSFDNNGSAIPGAFVEVYLIGNTKPNAIVLPVDAISEQQGKYYVYIKLDDECYEKRLVTIGSSNGTEVEILSGLSRKDEVVTKGAIIVKLAESSGAVPEGHSHNH